MPTPGGCAYNPPQTSSVQKLLQLGASIARSGRSSEQMRKLQRHGFACKEVTPAAAQERAGLTACGAEP